MRKLITNITTSKQRIGFLLFFTLFFLPNLSAQKQVQAPFFEFEQIDLPGGLQGNTVNCMTQDEYGFVWFGTVSGLTRYDGRDFIRYHHNPLDSNSLIDNYVESILIDSKGNFWIGSLGKGLTKFQSNKQEFVRYQPQQNHPNGLIDGIINTMIEDQKGNIWIGTNTGITKFNPLTEKFTHYKGGASASNGLLDGRVRVLYEDSKGMIWAGTGLPWEYNPAKGGLYKLNPSTEKITAYLHDPKNPKSLSDNRVGAIFEDSRGSFWVGTMGDGLQSLNKKTGKFTRYPFQSTNSDQLSRPFLTLDKTVDVNYSQVGFIHEDSMKNLWIGAFYGGVNVYNPVLKRQTHIEQNSPYQAGLTTNYIWDILQTEDQSIFICTGGNGGGKTYKVNFKTSHFPFYKIEDNRQVSYLTEDNKGNIWLGFLDGQNLIKFNDLSFGVDEKEGLNIHSIEEIERVSVPKDIQQCGSILLEFTPEGIQLIDVQSSQVKVEIAIEEEKNDLKANTIWIIQEDLNHDFWIATWGGGLFFVDTQTETIINFQHDKTNSSTIGGNYVSHIFEDRKGNIWIAGGQKSNNVEFPLFIDKFNRSTKTFEHFVAHDKQYGYVTAIAEDKEGNLWYPTTVDGIRKLNPTTKETTVFKQANSLIPSDEIRSLVIDHADKVWMSTEKTILKFDPLINSFVVYDEAEGIQINNFGFGVSFLTATGQAIFGGDGGFHIFDPIELTRKEFFHEPKIQITALQINNQPVSPGDAVLADEPIWEKEALDLSYRQNTFSFGINCLDYKKPDGIYLEYQLENYDQIWRKAGSEKTANYVNVPPGEYVFKVRGTNSEGYWNKAGKSIELTISPPWWQTWWARLIGMLLGIMLLYALYRFQLNRRLLEQERVQLKEIDALKTRLYSNITHEFRTPLTLIIGLSKQLIDSQDLRKEVATKLKTIERNGEQSLRLVNQLLDLRKLETGHLGLQLIQSDILPLFRYVHDNFHSFAASKDIDLGLNLPKEPIIMDYDPNRVYEVISNLVINAIKYTPADGSIYLTVNRIKAKDKETLSFLMIKVKDSGIGIPEADMPYVFDRFHQVEARNNESGTGIGLALVKEFTELMGGKVKVKSILNVGSEFDVFLPITNSASAAKHFLKSDMLNKELLTISSPVSTVSQSTQADPKDKRLILIVEDNEEVAHFIASFLDKYAIHFAKNGQEGTDKALELIPDLIISDVMMPQKNGFELCEQLKDDERTSHIPIILLTARTTNTDKISGLKKGADAYLTKPFSHAELQLWVANLLQSRKELHQRYAKPNLPSKPEKVASLDLAMEDAFVKKVITLIEKNSPDPDYSVALIAEAVHLSSSQLHRKVSAVTGKSPIQLIRLYRLNKAKELLRNQALSISQVAYQAGFNDPSYFTRTFTKVFKQKPTEFRESQ